MNWRRADRWITVACELIVALCMYVGGIVCVWLLLTIILTEV